MPTKYDYVRNKLVTGYDLEVKIDINGEEATIHPNSDISALFPDRKFCVFGEDKIFRCCFELPLDTAEKSQLDAFIESYRTGV